MNQKPYNKQLINLICSVCTEKYLPSSFLFTPRSFVLRSVRKLHAGKYMYFALIKHLMMYFVIVFRISLAYFLSHDFFSRIYIYKFTQFFIHSMFLSDEWPTLETLDFAFYIGSTPTFLYFDFYLNTDLYFNLFILRIVSRYCLVRRTLHFMFVSDKGPTLQTLDFVYFNTTFISICLFTYRNKKCQCFS